MKERREASTLMTNMRHECVIIGNEVRYELRWNKRTPHPMSVM